jgi:hypothetical protein
MLRQDPQLQNACTNRYFLEDIIQAWKTSMINEGDPPRNVSRRNIVHRLHYEWGLIGSFTKEIIVWKEDTKGGGNEETLSFDDMLAASLDK